MHALGRSALQRSRSLATLLVLAASAVVHAQGMQQMVIVPEEDRFTPFSMTIHVGDTVEWVNQDTDDHTVVSDKVLNDVGVKRLNHKLLGTEHNGGVPGTFQLTFDQAGRFVFYCRFHSHLDKAHQPVAPGPRGGIQDSKGNFGTPMMGVITVLP